MKMFKDLMKKVADAAREAGAAVGTGSKSDGLSPKADAVSPKSDALPPKAEPVSPKPDTPDPAPPVDGPKTDPAPAPYSASREPELAGVNLEEALAAKADAHPEDLDWRKSIVDLLKLLGIDSSFGARKELALELGYTQEQIDNDGSAEMNMFLHKEVLRKLAENGGDVPADLLD